MRRHALLASLAALAIVLAIITTLEPILADGWGHYSSARRGQNVRELADDFYHYGNPRWGQVILAIAFRTPLIEIVVTPLVLVAFVLVVQTMVMGRWPRARDGATPMLCVTALLLVMTPQVGTVWFYKAVCTNYVYPHVVQLLWLVPYRFLVERPRPARPWLLAVVIVPLGFLAGAGNEHTSVGLGVAAIGAAAIAWRRDRHLPAWTLLGIAALVAGTVFLLTAPGQAQRYDGLGNTSLFAPLLERGLLVTAAYCSIFLAWSAPMVLLVGGLAWRVRYVPSPAVRRRLAACVVIALAFVATIALSPKIPPRMFVAPATALAVALGGVVLELRAQASVRRTAVAIVVAVLATTLAMQIVTFREARTRLRLLETAAPGSALVVPRFTFWRGTPFAFGDDFRHAWQADRVADIFGLDRIELGD